MDRSEVLDACVRDFLAKANQITRTECVAVLDDPSFKPAIAGYIPARAVEYVVMEAFVRRSKS